MKRFIGVWATFSNFADLDSVVSALSDVNTDHVVVHTPFSDASSDSLPFGSNNTLKYFSLIGAVFGAVLAGYFSFRVELTWIRPLSAKPILAPLTMVPVVFELAILSAVLFTVGGIALNSIIDRFMNPLPQSDGYLTYRRFTRDRFGIVIRCRENLIPVVHRIIVENQPEEVFIEK